MTETRVEKCDFCEADATNMVGDAFGGTSRLLFVCPVHLKAVMRRPAERRQPRTEGEHGHG